MIKLMKYEFRKLRTVLLVMLLILVGLQLGFVLSNALNREALTFTFLALTGALTFAVYAYILIAGIVSYSRELSERSGYLVFMTPVRPIGIVLSKLVFTMLAAAAVTALFGVVFWLDLRFIAGKYNVSVSMLEGLNGTMRLFLQDGNFDLWLFLRSAGLAALEVLIGMLLLMCTAYLAVTLSATLLQNRKGFLRGLISVLLFVGLNYGASWAVHRGSSALTSTESLDSAAALVRISGVTLLLSLVFCALFAWISAELLKRKVSL